MSVTQSHLQEGITLQTDEDIIDPADVKDYNEVEEEESEPIGDEIIDKPDGLIRIGLINIRGIPETNEDPKNEHTKAMIDACGFDHTGLTEINKQWRAVDQDHRWHERTRKWWRNSKSVVTYNEKDIFNNVFQPGGTINLTKDDLTHRVHKSGADSLLGRWSWTSYRGCNGIVTTVITGYRPCRNNNNNNTKITSFYLLLVPH